MVQTANTAGVGTHNTETVGKDEAGKAFDTHGIGACAGLRAGAAVLTALGVVGCDLGASFVIEKDVPRRTRRAFALTATVAGDAGESASNA